MIRKAGASDPLVEACAEAAELLRTLGVANPMEQLRPVFARVRKRWAGERVYIAQHDAAEREARDQAIQTGIAAGVPTKTIAAQVGVHPTTVWRKATKEWEL